MSVLMFEVNLHGLIDVKLIFILFRCFSIGGGTEGTLFILKLLDFKFGKKDCNRESSIKGGV